MSSSGRNQRHARRQQRLREPPAPQSNTTLSPPHPYHENPPPPPPSHHLLQQRSTSTDSKVSDLSMDDFATGSALESVFEYSDTSDDMREDTYFLPEENPYSPASLLGNQAPFPRRPHNPYQRNGGRNDSGESAFREIKRTGSQSSHIVQFSSQSKNDSFSDSEVGELGGDVFHDSDNDGSEEDSSNVQVSGPKSRNKVPWMKRVAYAFRSPSGIHDQDNKHAKQQFEKSRHEQGNSSRKKSTHNRMPSGSTMEYAHALVRYPSQPKSEINELHASSYETSPLLAGSLSVSNYSQSQLDRRTNTATMPATSRTKPMEGSIQKRQKDANGNLSGTFMPMQPRYIFASRRTAVQVAAYYLMDYEASRPPTLSSNFETITKEQLLLYRIHFSLPWRSFVNMAIVLLFLSHTQDLLVIAM